MEDAFMKVLSTRVGAAWRAAAIFGALALGLAGMARSAGAQETTKLMDYYVAVVSDYVFRGADVYRSVYAQREEEESAFNVAPALQPNVSFYSTSGFWFNFWGSFALTEREEDEAKGFSGLATLDEVDTTLGYDWENRLGTFSVGIINYALIHPSVQGEPGANIQEMFFKWGLPVMEDLGPTLSHYVDSSTANTYTAVSVGGGEALSWGVNVGYGSRGAQGIQDVTATLAYALGGGLAVNGNVAYRPTPQLHGYTSDGKYLSAKDGSEQDYPPALIWLGVSWGGEVTE
jgi:hypothetical protein